MPPAAMERDGHIKHRPATGLCPRFPQDGEAVGNCFNACVGAAAHAIGREHQAHHGEKASRIQQLLGFVCAGLKDVWQTVHAQVDT